MWWRINAVAVSSSHVLTLVFMFWSFSDLPVAALDKVNEQYLLPRMRSQMPGLKFDPIRNADNSTDEATSEANLQANSTLASFNRWLKHFANPVVCNMIFCHSSCSDYDDACPSFRHHLLSILDEKSCLDSSPPSSQMPAPASVCCGNDQP